MNGARDIELWEEIEKEGVEGFQTNNQTIKQRNNQTKKQNRGMNEF